jgi:hypothetical protein
MVAIPLLVSFSLCVFVPSVAQTWNLSKRCKENPELMALRPQHPHLSVKIPSADSDGFGFGAAKD